MESRLIYEVIRMMQSLYVETEELRKHEDGGGIHYEVFRRDRFPTDVRQMFVSIVKPGAVRGNHFHKDSTQWYCVIKGTGMIKWAEACSEKGEEIIVSENLPTLVRFEPGVAHAIQNVGSSEMHLLTLLSKEHDPHHPDIEGRELI